VCFWGRKSGEAWLWHGTGALDPRVVCREGFASALPGRGANQAGDPRGRATLFAHLASYPARNGLFYASAAAAAAGGARAADGGDQEVREVLLACVAAGRSQDTWAESVKELARPENGFQTASARDDNDSRVTAIYCRHQAYPAYLVRYLPKP